MRDVMKGLVMLALAICAVPREGLAQLPGLGLKGGLNLAALGGKDAGPVERRTGLSLGAFINISTGPRLSLQPEAYYTQKGARYAGANDTFTYLEAPLLLRYSTPLPAAPFRPFIFAGPTAALLLSAKMGEADVKSLYRTSDFGLALGGGVEFERLSLDARYQLGLTSIAKDVGQFKADYRNRVLSVLLGYRLF